MIQIDTTYIYFIKLKMEYYYLKYILFVFLKAILAFSLNFVYPNIMKKRNYDDCLFCCVFVCNVVKTKRRFLRPSHLVHIPHSCLHERGWRGCLHWCIGCCCLRNSLKTYWLEMTRKLTTNCYLFIQILFRSSAEDENLWINRNNLKLVLTGLCITI